MSKGKEEMSLAEFARAERRADCPVCKLSQEVRDTIALEMERGMKRKVVLKWLANVKGVTITDQEMTVHRNGRHDEAA